MENLTDRLELLSFSQQAWGELGINVCAHGAGQNGLPLQIGEKKYARGLGHHAAGQIIIDLNGEYDRFEAELGVQPLPGGVGTVVFKIFVDDRLAFHSGVLKAGQPPRPIAIDVPGAVELRLETEDAGDGITCDCANWAEARLRRAAVPATMPAIHRLDVAPFARVVTSDPARVNGCTAQRTEEYRAEDVFLETDLRPDGSGAYTVPASSDGRGVIGLRWLERRSFRELGIDFVEGRSAPSVEGVQIQFWTGESAWQGQWQPLKTEIRAEGNHWRAVINGRGAPELSSGTRRIRWILPAQSGTATISKLSAISPTPLREVSLRLECDASVLGDAGAGTKPGDIGMYNGEFLEPVGRGTPPHVPWNHRSGEPLTLSVRYAAVRPDKRDRTVLQIRMPNGAFGIAVDDVLEQGQVYVKPFGVFVSMTTGGSTLQEYRRQIVKNRTLLEEVRHRPDQTFAQAIEKLHNPVQDSPPTMLSLACDNHKFIVQRDGAIRFAGDQSKPTEMDLFPPKNMLEIAPRFGKGRQQTITRKLEGGWVPIVLNETREEHLVCKQRTGVVALESTPLPEPGWLSPHPLAMVEFTIENTSDQATDASLAFAFASPSGSPLPSLSQAPGRVLAIVGDRLVACFDTGEAKSLQAESKEATLTLTGSIAAHGSARCTLYLPGWALPPGDQGQLSGGTRLLDRIKPYWEHVLAPAAQIELPDELLVNVIKASQVHCLMAARNEADGQRVAAWIASMHYGPLESEANSIIRGMDYLGHHEFARRAHDYFIHRYNAAGFLTTGYTLMGTGWQLWALGEHYALTRDGAWLKRVAPEVARVCKWIMAQREKTKQLDAFGQEPPEFGLMPPGVMADWNAYAYHFCLNAYYYAALQAAGTALSEIDYPEAKTWLDNAADFRERIIRAYRWTQARTPVGLLRDGTAVPGYPSQVHSPGPLNNFFAGEDGNRSWCYDVELGAHHLVPLGVLDPDARDTTWIVEHQEDVQFLANGWFDFPAERNQKDPFNYGGFAKVQPYYCRNGEVYALRDDVRPFIRTYFNTIPTLLNLENLSFQEHFAGAGAWNKTHETGYFLHQTRLMLVMEKDKELRLASFVTSNWMKDGNVVSIENAPTKFGPVGFRIVSHVSDGHMDATITPPQRSSPEVIILRLRHPEGKPMKSVQLDGQPYSDFDPARERIRLRPQRAPITIKAAY